MDSLKERNPMKTPILLATLALALVAQNAAAQGLAGTMTAIGVGSTLQGIGGMNYGAIRSQARGVSNANNNYQSALNGQMTDPNTTTTTRQQSPPPPPPNTTATGGAGNPGNNSTNSTGGAGGFVQTGRPISAQSAALVAQARTNPRNILSTMGGFSAGTNQLSSRPRISLRVQTSPISSSRRSGITTGGGGIGSNQQNGGATGGQQGGQGGQGGGAAPGAAGGATPPPPVDPNAAGN